MAVTRPASTSGRSTAAQARSAASGCQSAGNASSCRSIAPPEGEEDSGFPDSKEKPAGEPLLCVCNFSPVVRDGYRLGSPAAVWTPVLNTDELRFGGSGVALPDQIKTEASPWHGRPHSLTMTLPPLSAVWLRRDRG